MSDLPPIKNIVKDNFVHFHRFRAGHFWYRIQVYDLGHMLKVDHYMFPVPLEDIGDATLEAYDKAIFFMRYIRQAINNNTFVPYNQG
jgi:hypothetical protein